MKKKKPRRKIHEIDSSNDIRDRGPLSYQHLRIAAWLLVALSQLGFIMVASTWVFTDGRYYSEDFFNVISFLSMLALPLFLIANFSVILREKTSYKKLLIKFGAFAGGVIVFYFYVYERFVLGFFSKAVSRAEADSMIRDIIADRAFVAFNLFLDLFLCTLVMFFLNYTPKRVFVGKKRIIFRLFALAPILYEALSITLKALAEMGELKLPPLALPFLTTKPPMTFIVFVALALFIKQRERKFIKNGKTPEEYQEFLLTNSNSWHFSVFAAIIMAVAAIADLIIAVVTAAIMAGSAAGTEYFDFALFAALTEVMKWGIGGTAPLILVSPIMLLFSYNRTARFPKLDIVIPIAGVALIVIEYIEAAFFALMRIF